MTQSPHPELVPHGSVIAPPQLDGVYAQAAHEPDVGPLWLPGTHDIVSMQKPQPDRDAQSSQPVVPEQSAGGVPPPDPHALAMKSQTAQLPRVGPNEDPDSQRPSDAHQPQPAFGVQSSQLRLAAHGSLVPGPMLMHALGR
jgi:hypothetical protein